MTQFDSTQATTQLIGRYEVLKELGKGSMGIVLLARDPVLDRPVAVKFLRADLKFDSEARALLMRRMSQEARAIARVTHPGIIALHDIGKDTERGTFLVFEYAEGPTLQAVLERGRLTREGTARLAHELGDALSAAHSVSVVHRDIKPGNIILTEEGSRIADFGVARLPDSTLTQAGALVGTPAYSAPESVRDGEHSAKSDQFSMAACLYESLSGRRAHPGAEAVKVANSIQNDTPPPIAEPLGFDQKVDTVLLRGMAKSPSERFDSCKDLGLALSEALLGTREELPAMPDERLLIRHDKEDRSRKLGSAVLWLLVGATLATAVLRLSHDTKEEVVVVPPSSAPTTARDKVISRPAFLSLPRNEGKP